LHHIFDDNVVHIHVIRHLQIYEKTIVWISFLSMGEKNTRARKHTCVYAQMITWTSWTIILSTSTSSCMTWIRSTSTTLSSSWTVSTSTDINKNKRGILLTSLHVWTQCMQTSMHHNFIYCINARTHTHTSLVPWNRDFIVYSDSPGLIKVRCPAYSYVADQKCGNLPEFLTDTSAPRDVRPVPVCVYVDFLYNVCK
jgi:hypothetical protein